MRMKFLGESDCNFTRGFEYSLEKIAENDYFLAWISTDNDEIVCIPYGSRNKFNENWEVVEKKVEKTPVSLKEYNLLKENLNLYKSIPEISHEAAILERAIDRLEVWC